MPEIELDREVPSLHREPSRAKARSMFASAALRTVTFFVVAASVAACSGTAVGTGSTGGTGDPGISSNGGSTSSDTTSGGKSDPPASTTADFDKLFGAPESSSLTPDSLTGVWAGTVGSTDLRLKVTATSITIALRCSSSSRAVGLVVVAKVGAEGIRLLESKATPYDGSQPYCDVEVKPVAFSTCTAETYPYADAYACVGVKGTTLTIGGTLFTSESFSHQRGFAFTKLSD